MVSQWLFFALVVFVAIQRSYEMLISNRHEQKIKSLGGFEYAPRHFIVMKLMHVAWLVCMTIEVFLFDRGLSPVLGSLALAMFLLGQCLRIIAIKTLGTRWTASIMVIPNAPSVEHGIYKYIRHPNYLGVVLEILFLPLVHGAYLSAIAFTLCNAIVLWVRISNEEAILKRTSTSYFGLK